MGRRSDPDRVIEAQLTGTAAGYAVGKRCTRDEALAEIVDILARARIRPGTARAVTVLSGAASLYLEATGPGDEFWHPAAVDLLADAGADREQAKAIHQARSRNFRGSLR
jgi:hypothetical protein